MDLYDIGFAFLNGPAAHPDQALVLAVSLGSQLRAWMGSPYLKTCFCDRAGDYCHSPILVVGGG